MREGQKQAAGTLLGDQHCSLLASVSLGMEDTEGRLSLARVCSRLLRPSPHLPICRLHRAALGVMFPVTAVAAPLFTPSVRGFRPQSLWRTSAFFPGGLMVQVFPKKSSSSWVSFLCHYNFSPCSPLQLSTSSCISFWHLHLTRTHNTPSYTMSFISRCFSQKLHCDAIYYWVTIKDSDSLANYTWVAKDLRKCRLSQIKMGLVSVTGFKNTVTMVEVIKSIDWLNRDSFFPD